MCNTVKRNLSFLHSFEECGLYFRGGTVYLVRKQKVTHNSPVTVDKFSCFRVKHGKSCDIRGHDIGCKLYSVEFSAY